MRARLEKLLWLLLIILLPSQTAKHLWPSFSLINGIKIDYLSPSLYLSDLIIILLLLTHPFRLPPFNKKILLVLFLILLNIVFSLSPTFTFYKTVRIILYLFLTLLLISSREMVKKLFPVSLSLAVIWTGFLAVSQFLIQGSLGHFWQYLGERLLSPAVLNVAKISLGNLGLFMRAYATFPHPNALAGFLAVSFWILVYYAGNYRNKPELFLLLLSMFFSLSALILTFSRSAIFIFLTSVMYVIFSKKKLNRRLLPVFLLFITLLCSYLIKIGPPTSLSERYFLLQKSYFLISHHLFLGIGYGNFPLAGYPFSFSNPFIFFQPVHNVYLLLLTELGLPSFIIFCFILFRFIKNQLMLSPLYFRIAFINVLLLSLIDHYWLTSIQNQLLLTFLIFIIYVSPKHSKNIL